MNVNIICVLIKVERRKGESIRLDAASRTFFLLWKYPVLLCLVKNSVLPCLVQYLALLCLVKYPVLLYLVKYPVLLCLVKYPRVQTKLAPD